MDCIFHSQNTTGGDMVDTVMIDSSKKIYTNELTDCNCQPLRAKAAFQSLFIHKISYYGGSWLKYRKLQFISEWNFIDSLVARETVKLIDWFAYC